MRADRQTDRQTNRETDILITILRKSAANRSDGELEIE